MDNGQHKYNDSYVRNIDDKNFAAIPKLAYSCEMLATLIFQHSLYYSISYWFKSLWMYTLKIEPTQNGGTYIDSIQ